MTRKECLTHNFAKFSKNHRGGGEFFYDPATETEYDIRKAWHIITKKSQAARSRMLKRIKPIDTGEFIGRDPLNNDKVDIGIPLLCVRLPGEWLVIDGNHRSYKAYCLGKKIRAFIFTPRQAKEFTCAAEY